MYNNPFQSQQPSSTLPPVPPTNFGQPLAGQAPNPNAPKPPKKKMSKEDKANIIKLVTLITTSVLAVVFIGLFIWKNSDYTDIKENMDSKIDVAVAEAKDKQAEELEEEFAAREKYPYKTFVGPADYGELTFQYPKTWSVYVAADAANGGDFEAYFNPGEIEPISESNINALRVHIYNKSADKVNAEYKKELEKKGSNLKADTITVGGTTANRYTGTLPDTDDLNGYVVVFGIRDKTVVLQSDSVLFEGDFNALLLTVSFIK